MWCSCRKRLSVVVQIYRVSKRTRGGLTPRFQPTSLSSNRKIMTRQKIFAASLIPAGVLIFFLVAGLNSRAPAADVADPARVPAVRIPLDGVPNAGQVTPTLFRGAQPTREGVHALAASGIAIVVDLRIEGNRVAEKDSVSREGMRYVGIPWNCHNPSDAIVAQFLQVVRENPEKKIFVHCEHGVDRTGLMIATYRMANQGWTSEQAQQEMVAYGYDFVHRTWCHAVNSYESSFPQRFASEPEFESLRAAAQKSAAEK